MKPSDALKLLPGTVVALQGYGGARVAWFGSSFHVLELGEAEAHPSFGRARRALDGASDA